jgi:hypothetical protein
MTGQLVAAAGPEARDGWPAPVEYSVAVDRYLGQAALSSASRRVYRISLAGWAWPLVGRPIPVGAHRRRCDPPLVPLSLLDEAAAARRIRAAVADRAAAAGARTVNRELSAFRGAVAWWQDCRWIRGDPAAGLRHLRCGRAAPRPLTRAQADALFRSAPSLREHAFWRVLHDSGASAAEVLRLDVGGLDLARHRGRPAAGPGPGGPGPGGPGPGGWITWSAAASELLGWLTAGRPDGPVFCTDRPAPPGTAAADRCPLSGRSRLSYRRAAEILAAASRSLDPAGAGWTLHQVREAGRAGQHRAGQHRAAQAHGTARPG